MSRIGPTTAMQHNPNPPYQTPSQHDSEAEMPVTRGEFREVRDAVLKIERGMFGENRFEGAGMVAEHNEMKKKVAFVSKLAYVAFLGACGAVWAWITAKMQGKNP